MFHNASNKNIIRDDHVIVLFYILHYII